MSTKKIWDNFEEVGEVRKSNGKKFVIGAATLNGYRFITIREFYKKVKDNVWCPSYYGITVPLKNTLTEGNSWLNVAEDVLATMEKAREIAATMELADDAKAVWVEVKKK